MLVNVVSVRSSLTRKATPMQRSLQPTQYRKTGPLLRVRNDLSQTMSIICSRTTILLCIVVTEALVILTLISNNESISGKSSTTQLKGREVYGREMGEYAYTICVL